MAILGCGLWLEPEKSIAHLARTGLLSLSILPQQIGDLPNTLVGAAGWLLRHGPFPDEMRQLPLDLISTPFGRNKEDTGDEYSRIPDTGQAIDYWWECGLAQTEKEEADYADYPSAPPRWYWPVRGALPSVLAVTSGWQGPRQTILTWTELVRANPQFQLSTIDTISGAPGYSYGINMRLREFTNFLWTVLHCFLMPYLGWEGSK